MFFKLTAHWQRYLKVLVLKITPWQQLSFLLGILYLHHLNLFSQRIHVIRWPFKCFCYVGIVDHWHNIPISNMSAYFYTKSYFFPIAEWTDIKVQLLLARQQLSPTSANFKLLLMNDHSSNCWIVGTPTFSFLSIKIW